MGKPVIASDFYSLGTTLLVLLSRKEIYEMLENGIDLNWKSSVHVSNKMTHLLERLLDKKPEKRLDSLDELKEILLTDKYDKKEPAKSNKTESKIVEKKELNQLEFLANQDNSYLENLDSFDTNDTSHYGSAYGSAYNINKMKLTSFFILVALGIILPFAFISNSLSYNDDAHNPEYKDDTYSFDIDNNSTLKSNLGFNPNFNFKESKVIDKNADTPIKKLPEEGTHGYHKKIKTNTP